MSPDQKPTLGQRLRDVFAQVAGGSTSAALVTAGFDPLTSISAGAGVGAAVRAGGDAVLGHLAAAAKDKGYRAANELFSEIAALAEAAESEDERRRIFEEFAEDSSRDEMLLEGWRAMIASPTGAAWPALRHMTVRYWSAGRSADGLFRDACAVLTQSDAETMIAAAAILNKLHGVKEMIGPGRRVEVNYNPPPRSDLTFTAPQELEDKKLFTPAPSGVRRALRLLGANGFGRVREDRILLDGENAERCWQLLEHVRACDGTEPDPS